MEIVTKKIKRFDLESCSYKDIKSFYGEQCNKRTICLFYNKEKLITILSLEDFDQYCKDLFRFNRYLKLSSNNRIGYDLHSAKVAFKVLNKVTYLIQELYQEYGLFVYKNQENNDIAKRIYNTLSENDIHVFRINFPYGEDIVRENRANIYCSQPLSYYEKLVERGEIEPPYYLEKITNMKKCEFHNMVSLYGKTIGFSEKKKIYMVGPCIVAGWENFEGEKLVQILKAKLDNLGIYYEIKSLPMHLDDNYKILHENLNKNDIVFILDYSLYENENCLTDNYNKYSGGG